MSPESDPRTAFAGACRSQASTSISPFRRDHLQALARLSDCEAQLVQQSFIRIADSRKLIAQAEALLRRR